MNFTGPIPSPGHMGVDYETRVDFDRLRRYRLERAQKALASSECGAFLLFDFYNIRYTTQTWIGGALGDKMTRYALLTRDSTGPTLWDFGSAARHHKLFAPWLGESNSRAGMLGMRGAIAPWGGGRGGGGGGGRSAWTSSSRRSCSRCSARASRWSTRSSSCWTPA